MPHHWLQSPELIYILCLDTLTLHCVEAASLPGLFPNFPVVQYPMIKLTLTFPSLCDIEQYTSLDTIADGTYIKPVAVVLCLGNLVSALVPIRSHIAKTMYKSNNYPPNNKYKSNCIWWTQDKNCLPPNAQALPQWSSWKLTSKLAELKQGSSVTQSFRAFAFQTQT